MLRQINNKVRPRLGADSGPYRKQVWYFAGIPAAVSAVLMLLNLLSGYIAPEGGLSNMGTHTLIETGIMLLQVLSGAVLSFWSLGLVYSALAQLRGEAVDNRSFTVGLRRFVPVLVSWLLRGLYYTLIVTACATLSSVAISMLPLPKSVYEAANAFLEAPALPIPGSLLALCGCYLAIYTVSLGVLLVPVMYLHRLVDYCIMDDPPVNGMQSVMISSILMRGNRRKLFCLDLHFWWFYLAELLVLLLSSVELLLPRLLEILPFGPEVWAWVFPILALLAQALLYGLAKPRLCLSYAAFYDELLRQIKEEKPEEEKPRKKLPWKY